MTKQIVIAERDNIAALIENGKVTEFFVNKGEIFLNDVYLSTVDNILPSIEAAFVDVGSDKMGFLHADDVPGKGNLKTRLTPKQKLMVQVVKEPTGHKGPRVTTEISIPGRFLVLIPQETGIIVSRKIVSNKERARLKSIVSLIKPVGVGVIVRTEAEGQTDADIQEDLELLLEKWNSIITAAETQDAPSLLYRDQDLLYRVIREACTEDVTEIVLNVKGIIAKLYCDGPKTVYIEASGEGTVTAGDIHTDGEVEILNPELHIATLMSDARLSMEITLTNGRGYVSAERNKQYQTAIGVIPVDSIYTPVYKVNYTVENTRVGNMTDYDKLTLEVWTNSTISAKDAVSLGAKILSDHLTVFTNLSDAVATSSTVVEKTADRPDAKNCSERWG